MKEIKTIYRCNRCGREIDSFLFEFGQGTFKATMSATEYEKVKYVYETIIEQTDYDTNADVENAKKPLSHASLIKAYVEGIYPYDDIAAPQNKKASSGVIQLNLFD